ncbi:RES family NAD+ phosphorylase [Planctomycetota bacterium]
MDRGENYLGWIVTLLIEPIVGTIETQVKDGVSLYSNRGLPFIRNLQEDFSSVCSFFMSAIKDHGPKVMEPEAIKYLAPYVTKFTSKITRNKSLYRARLGYKKRGHKYDHLDDTISDVYFPFTGRDISAPPMDKTRNNRLNQQGHSFLYLSSNEATALSEIKPYPGQFVSLGQFYPKKNLLLADLNNLDFSNYWLTDDELDIYVFLRTLGYWYSFPVPPDSNQSLYSSMQFFSAVFKALGFDGITYRSSITDGANYVVFQQSLMRYRRSSGKCVNVKSLLYTYKSVFYETTYEKSDYVSYDIFSTNSDHTSHIYKEP